ncbi:ATP-binding protein [Oceanospirillum sediminis]|uniref:ATP-binding protein n=1 Tax=Oceanospirillum sediminis TaxID=2760088 RepID=A0A839INY1_9GAMM|nr:ATP-binding protein [Oceanospirillum sediminis]MBB1486394.1 ATP-binding protein [Oceanospirillum sediminis]
MLNKKHPPDHQTSRNKRHSAEQSDSGLHTVLQLENSLDDALLMKSPLRIQEEYLHRFTTATPFQPERCESFPARRVTTSLSWQDIVLPDKVMDQVLEIQDWIQHGAVLLNDWGMADRIRPGYRALFYGPPGTGKTLTACLLGNATGRDVYKVDLSLIVSKYIGETEKNLEKVFSLAMDKDWILFFDEADALFGKRVEAAGANDQFANQNVAYLLQRIEQFNGIVILASNLKDNLDEAFNRRFESMIYFPLPSTEQRLSLWQQGFSARCRLEPEVDLSHIATEHVLSGAEIINVIRYASLKAICRHSDLILEQDLQEGIQREQQKAAGIPSQREQQRAAIFS